MSNYRLDFDHDVLKEIIDPKTYTVKVARQLLVKIVSLAVDPRPSDHIQLKGGYRVDIGEHRIFYEIDDKERIVTIRVVGPRNDDAIYKKLKRKLGN